MRHGRRIICSPQEENGMLMNRHENEEIENLTRIIESAKLGAKDGRP